MQDFGKDELGLLGTGIVVNNEKDHSGNQSAVVGIGVDEIKLTSIPDLLEPGDGGSKLEEADRDLYPWHTEADVGSRFLRSSDDPLISGGTNDIPHDNELSVPTDVSRQSMCPSPTTPPPSKHRHSSVTVLSSPDLPETVLSPLPTPPKAPAATAASPQQHQQQPRARRTPASNTAPRARRKGPIKLRFHHQALPQEYLDHYEATQNNLHRTKDQPPSSSQSKPTARQQHQQQQQQQRHQTERSAHQAMMERQAALEREERANESVRSWLQKILELQKEGIPLAPPRDELLQPQSHQSPPVIASGDTLAPAATSKRVVSYTDLPYMGEITLDNSKPRRGRKPKKADICHLIYKNYGTILPGTPNRELTLEKTPMAAKGCSKSVASLLERRLTSSDERQRKAATASGASTTGNGTPKLCPDGQEKGTGNGMRKEAEPLNLCVRDSSGSNCGLLAGEESFSVSSSEEDPDEVFASSCPTPIITQSDLCTDQALATNMKLSLPTLQSSSGSTTETPSTADTPPGAVYWSSAHAGSLFTHPMPMYFPGQPLALMPATEEPPKADSLSSASSPAVSPDGQHQPLLLVPKHISQLIKPESKPSGPQNGTSSTGGNRRSPPTPKRKRSAIFIPPVPAENSSNPATEVSICKFKFTGGAKPCLQEKKILSVDSGGNFRYYSGTGDKSMRGYEFFPRESLQQSSITATSTTGAFLNASGERIACDLPPPSLGLLSSDLLQIPEFPTSPQPACSHLHLPSGANGSTPTSPTPSTPSGGREPPAALLPHHQQLQQLQHTASERRRRKSRRATQRECLEKTFKEKGFLIQTQQLQSAEGATYCKFRQLRKFTRYLFRSWKDYLPGELQQQQQNQQQVQQQQPQPQLLPGVMLPTELTSDEAPTSTVRMLVDSAVEDDAPVASECVLDTPRKHPAIEGHRTGSVSPIGD
ncbi:uncharacterized protein LOC118465071 isoform X2 [Anopheles albimanus]|nr:uncharacterized protein LOC118465071 isoform X2 [Anopheles albimanus]XP_035788853.1 uncharacterized protein LOC118465071 isoform X2 [Anopheles albimanus]XP_035788854.1 uncharacterized protein LOC118465071 isoform X2 [Anopheles albimanus]